MPVKEIGAAIQAVADKHKYGLVKVFVGHGVGTVFHSWPHVAHHRWDGRGTAEEARPAASLLPSVLSSAAAPAVPARRLRKPAPSPPS